MQQSVTSPRAAAGQVFRHHFDQIDLNDDDVLSADEIGAHAKLLISSCFQGNGAGAFYSCSRVSPQLSGTAIGLRALTQTAQHAWRRVRYQARVYTWIIPGKFQRLSPWPIIAKNTRTQVHT